jgi:hypothetical protein
MRTAHGRNFAPKDPSGICRTKGRRIRKRKVLDALGVKVNFAMLVACETLEQLGKSAFRAMATVHER